jgi:hypothetical protein
MVADHRRLLLLIVTTMTPLSTFAWLTIDVDKSKRVLSALTLEALTRFSIQP